MNEQFQSTTLPRQTRKQEMMMQAKAQVAEMIEKNKEGQLLYSVYVQTGNDFSPDRLDVRRIDGPNGDSYIYTAFKYGEVKPGEEKRYDTPYGTPYYYAESEQLLPVFETYQEDSIQSPFISFAHGNYTAYNGEGIGIYIGARSYIQRNLTGTFKEYIDEAPNKLFYITFQANPDNDYQIGFIRHTQDVDSIPLFTADFGRNELYVVSQAVIGKNDEGKDTVKIMSSNLEEDGKIDYQKSVEYTKHNLREAGFLEGRYISDAELEKLATERVRERATLAQSVFYDVYDRMGLPIINGVKRNPLLGKQSLLELEDRPSSRTL